MGILNILHKILVNIPHRSLLKAGILPGTSWVGIPEGILSILCRILGFSGRDSTCFGWDSGWDPAQDNGTFQIGSQVGYFQSHAGSQVCPWWWSPTGVYGTSWVAPCHSHLGSLDSLEWDPAYISRYPLHSVPAGSQVGIWNILHKILLNIPHRTLLKAGIPPVIMEPPGWDSVNPMQDPGFLLAGIPPVLGGNIWLAELTLDTMELCKFTFHENSCC